MSPEYPTMHYAFARLRISLLRSKLVYFQHPLLGRQLSQYLDPT